MKTSRTHYTPEEKVAILRRHLLEQVPVSRICEELHLRPTVFYRWQKELFENGAAAFRPNGKSQLPSDARKISVLEEKLQRKNEVVAELMKEHIQLKKSLGEL